MGKTIKQPDKILEKSKVIRKLFLEIKEIKEKKKIIVQNLVFDLPLGSFIHKIISTNGYIIK